MVGLRGGFVEERADLVVVRRDGPGWWSGTCEEEPGVFVVGRRKGEVEELLRGLVERMRAAAVDERGEFEDADERG